MFVSKIPHLGFMAPDKALAGADSLRWVIAMVWSGYHARIARDLRRDGWSVYAPIGSRFSQRTVGRASGLERRVRCIQRYPVFGAYVFVGHSSRLIGKSAHEKIVDVLGDEFGPIMISAEVIRMIAQADLDGEWHRTVTRANVSEFQPGQEIRVKEGPMAGFLATVVGLRGELRYQIETSIFGRSTKMTVEAAQIEKV
jgi:transcription antitermination factor NusG